MHCFTQFGNSQSVYCIPVTNSICKAERKSSAAKNESKWKLICSSATDQQEIAKILKKMKNKSSSPDRISNEILKCCSPVVESFIESAFNQCLLERTYSANIKTAKVILLHKKGDKSNPENYRPISFLNAVGIFLRN